MRPKKPNRTLWQRFTDGIGRMLPRAWRGESDDFNGYLVSPFDIFDGQKGVDHSLFSMLYAWRNRRLPGASPPPGQTFSRDHSRELARILEATNPFAQGILSALRSYVLGEKGLHVEVIGRQGTDPDEMLLADAQGYLDEFMDSDDWWSRERELYIRCHRDGEGILRYFAGRHGVCVRFIEPEWIVPPDASPEWTEGVRNDPEDAETIDAVWVQTGTTPQDGEEVPASEIYMIRSNVDKCIKRGLSDFASISALIMKTLDCLQSMIGAEGVRQGIVMITHHEHSAPADLDAFVANQTDYIDRSRREGFGGDGGPSREVPTQAVSGVREIHLTGPQKLAALPTAGQVKDATDAINTALLSAASRYHMPLWVISGDASRNNALDLQAEGPFGKFITDEAACFSRHVRNIMWRVLQIGVERGELPSAILDEMDLAVTPQKTTEQRDPTRDTTRNKMLFDAGIMGKTTWSAREGLDFDAEQDDIRAHGGPPPVPPGASPRVPGAGAMVAANAIGARLSITERVDTDSRTRFFKDCDRDEKGHCVGTGGGGAGGGGEQGAGKEAPRATLREKAVALMDAGKAKLAEAGKAIYERMPAPLQKVVDIGQAVEHKLQGGYKAAQELAVAVAAEQGLGQEHTERVGRILATADAVARWTTNIPVLHHAIHVLAHIGGPVAFVAAKAGFYIPVASLGYVGYHVGKTALGGGNPITLIRSARRTNQGPEGA